jgi:single-stranded-DNA-specific exonuclease
MTYRWVPRSVDNPEAVQRLQRELNDLPEALARVLVLRGIDSFDAARHFFRAGRKDLHDPFLMQDMDRAADRVAAAVEQGERVLVYGDYDVDGTTATTLLTDFLRTHGADAGYFIPDRYEDGYGLGERGIDTAAEQGAGLIIALDCGITAHEEANYARSKDIDLIICDHHKPKDTLPAATAVLNPKREDCSYPFDELSGCGVGFKLVQATLDRLGEPPERAFDYLDLMAISTAADIVPLHGENRVLLREGLRAIETNPRLGVRALADAARFELTDVTTGDVVFKIGPRINAAGRMAHAEQAVALLLADDPDEAKALAAELEALNKERRSIDQETLREAKTMAERQITARNPHALVLYQPDWHLGVIGIVASRIVEQFYRPTVMLCRNGDAVKGSARSISGVNIYNALTACEDVLTQFGGHDYAAGMSLPEDNVDPFRNRLNDAIGEVVTAELLTPAIKIDAPLDLRTIGSVDDRFWAILKQFGPFGPANSKPVFHAADVTVVGQPRTVGSGGKHLKFKVRQRDAPNGPAIDVIGFGMGDQLSTLKESQRTDRPLELLFSLESNTWKGRTSLQLKARALRLANDA